MTFKVPARFLSFYISIKLSSKPKISATREATRIYQFINNNHASLDLWWKENLVNIQKLTKYYVHNCRQDIFKGTLSGLRYFLETESPLKIMKNAFFFTAKSHFVLEIIKFLSWLFCHVEKRLDSKAKINFKSYDITTWETNNWRTHIVQYLKN